MTTDYLIIGQGICGTLLSRQLLKQGKRVIVIDEFSEHSASRVASGLINPVTGQRLVKMPDFENYLRVALQTYRDLETELDIMLLAQYNILHFHSSPKARDLFRERSLTEQKYLHAVSNEAYWQQYFRFENGAGEISPSWLLDLSTLLEKWRDVLLKRDALLAEKFEWAHCRVLTDHVIYKNITAGKLICCEGAAGKDNPYFSTLPYTQNKGEIIIASIPGLRRDTIYKQDIFIVPWKNDLFWIGPSSEWNFPDLQPSAAFRKSVTDKLDHWLKLPYAIVDHWVSQRPTTSDHNPLMGCNPEYPSVAVLNGMGSKGCLLAPEYTRRFAAHYNNTSEPLKVK